MPTMREEFLDIFHKRFLPSSHDTEQCEKLADEVMELFGYSTGSPDMARRCIILTRTQHNNKIAAIKEYRTRTQATLKEALDAINAVWED